MIILNNYFTNIVNKNYVIFSVFFHDIKVVISKYLLFRVLLNLLFVSWYNSFFVMAQSPSFKSMAHYFTQQQPIMREAKSRANLAFVSRQAHPTNERQLSPTVHFLSSNHETKFQIRAHFESFSSSLSPAISLILYSQLSTLSRVNRLRSMESGVICVELSLGQYAWSAIWAIFIVSSCISTLLRVNQPHPGISASWSQLEKESNNSSHIGLFYRSLHVGFVISDWEDKPIFKVEIWLSCVYEKFNLVSSYVQIHDKD